MAHLAQFDKEARLEGINGCNWSGTRGASKAVKPLKAASVATRQARFDVVSTIAVCIQRRSIASSSFSNHTCKEWP